MKKAKTLSYRQLRPICDFGQLEFKTTAELKKLKGFVGQTRAIEAMQFATEIRKQGYNLFVAGSIGVGKYLLTENIIREKAEKQNAASDWCYVTNPADPLNPIALELATGKALDFSKNFSQFIKKIKDSISSGNPCNSEQLIATFTKKFNRDPHSSKLTTYLYSVESDITQHAGHGIEYFLTRYKVNVLIHHRELKHAPVILEDNPTYENLFGKVEYFKRTHLISPGSLHKANGGYLMLDVNKLILIPSSWDALKRALVANYIKIDNHEKPNYFIHSATVSPEPIPLNVKIILLGTRSTYYLLCDDDPEFLELFKVFADCNEYISRNVKNTRLLTRFMVKIIDQENLLTFNKAAIEQILLQSSRIIDDKEKLSLHISYLTSLLCESSYCAERSGKKYVNAKDVKQAVQFNIRQLDRFPKQMLEEINRNYVLIEVKGTQIGQINALTVVQIGNILSGHPVRVSSIARIGRGNEIVNIEREADLSGSVHSKGVLILYGFLKSRYSLLKPLMLAATLVFEQTYDGIDGDSASAAELCVLLSAIAGIPIKQSIAVTGAVNQHGEIQAVDCVNEKIEGFFDVCQTKGFTKHQGVIIPDSNVQNLILKDDVVDAVKKNAFHIYPVKHIDEVISILSGITAGRRNKKSAYPKSSVNFMVEERLKSFSEEIIDENLGE